MTTEPRASRADAGRVDHAFLRRAIDSADLNALRIALLQLTGDPVLEKAAVRKEARRGGALMASAIDPKDIETVKQRAFDILSQGELPDPKAISNNEVRRLIDLFNGEQLSDEEFRLAYEELALDEFPRDVHWHAKPDAAKLERYHVVVIGCGFSGIAMAVQLGRLGIPYTIIEKLGGVGGTWLRNTYPGVRVDTNCYTYQFKFEKEHRWSEYFPVQDEIRRYLVGIAEKYDVLRHVRFNTELLGAKWDDASGRWHLALRSDGVEEAMEVPLLVSAAGLFGEANLPDIEGIENFRGRIFHTTDWDHSYDYAGKRVALIGNGSTGTQLMPGIAEKASALTVYQRTPQWIGPMENHRQPISAEVRWLLDNVPLYWNWYGYSAFANFNGIQYVQENDPEWKKHGGLVSERNDRMRQGLIDYIKAKLAGRPDLIAKSIPDYAPLARRLIVDNGWYDALRRDNVELDTHGVARFTETGILDRAGVERPFDLVILGSGYKVSQYLYPVEYVGRNGTALEQAWSKDGPRSYLGVTMPGFPNFFMLYGPGSQARGGGLPSWIEIWVRYILENVVRLIENGSHSLEVRQDVFDAYNVSVDEHARQLVWETDGKGSYYVTSGGRSYVNQPWRNVKYHAVLAAADPGDFIVK